MLRPGDVVPEFTLPLAKATGARAPVPFRDLLGRGPVVIAFYPLAFTLVCTREMCDLRDRRGALDGLGAAVVGFSVDAAPSNAAFARDLGLAHGIYSDANRDVVETIWQTQTVLGVARVAKRGWMVVDGRGVVVASWITDDPEEWTGVGPIAEALRGAR